MSDLYPCCVWEGQGGGCCGFPIRLGLLSLSGHPLLCSSPTHLTSPSHLSPCSGDFVSSSVIHSVQDFVMLLSKMSLCVAPIGYIMLFSEDMVSFMLFSSLILTTPGWRYLEATDSQLLCWAPWCPHIPLGSTWSIDCARSRENHSMGQIGWGLVLVLFYFLNFTFLFSIISSCSYPLSGDSCHQVTNKVLLPLLPQCSQEKPDLWGMETSCVLC